MSELGVYTAYTSVEICYDRPNGPPIEVEVEITGRVYCDDPEWGLEATDVTAKIIGRDLDEDEIDVLDLVTPLLESTYESQPIAPKIGDYYKCRTDGYVWQVKDVVRDWEDGNRRYVILERPKARIDFRGPLVERRSVPLDVFDFCSDNEGKALFDWIRNEPAKPGEKLVPSGEV